MLFGHMWHKCGATGVVQHSRRSPLASDRRCGSCCTDLRGLTPALPQEEMLGKVNDGDWSVLVMDPEATRIMSAACRVSEILNYGVARARPQP